MKSQVAAAFIRCPDMLVCCGYLLPAGRRKRKDVEADPDFQMSCESGTVFADFDFVILLCFVELLDLLGDLCTLPWCRVYSVS